jgi:hypothetical protein
MLPARGSSLQVRFLVLMLLAVLPGFGLTCYLGVVQRQQGMARAREDALQLARVLAADQAHLIEAERQFLTTLAQLPEVLVGDAVACQARFADLLRQYPR